MKLLSLVAFAHVAVYHGHLVQAQNCVATALSAIPSCAQNCILNGATSIGCGGTDFSCQCQKTAALFAAVDGCVAASCPSASFEAVLDGASTVCACASPAVLAGGTASVSGISVTVPVSNTAWTTTTTTTTEAASGTTSRTVTAGSSTPTATTGASGSLTTSVTTHPGGSGSSEVWTGYSSVGTIATAYVVGAAARPTPAFDAIRYVVPVVVAGAMIL